MEHCGMEFDDIFNEEVRIMRLWIDDVRPAPDGYKIAKGDICAIICIIGREVDGCPYELLDIDNNKGEHAPLTGVYRNLLAWLEETDRNYPIRIHGTDPAEVASIRAIIEKNGWKEIK
jgi:hypothetical protein